MIQKRRIRMTDEKKKELEKAVKAKVEKMRLPSANNCVYSTANPGDENSVGCDPACFAYQGGGIECVAS
jgi:hypothetical protein